MKNQRDGGCGPVVAGVIFVPSDNNACNMGPNK